MGDGNLITLGGFIPQVAQKVRYSQNKIDNPYLQKLETPYTGIKETPIVATSFGIGPKLLRPCEQKKMTAVSKQSLGLVGPGTVTYNPNYGSDPLYGGTKRGRRLDDMPDDVAVPMKKLAMHKPPTTIRMRGVPWRATREQIAKFFLPLKPIEIEIVRDDEGRPNGTCRVEFATFPEAKEALSKNREYMGTRWVDLQLVNAMGERVYYSTKRLDQLPVPSQLPVGSSGGGEAAIKAHVAHYAQFMDMKYEISESIGYKSATVEDIEEYQRRQEMRHDSDEDEGGRELDPFVPMAGSNIVPNDRVRKDAKTWKSQFDEWEKYWREYNVYKYKYEAWANEQKKKGISVPPCEPPKAPPDPTAEGYTSKIAARFEKAKERQATQHQQERYGILPRMKQNKPSNYGPYNLT